MEPVRIDATMTPAADTAFTTGITGIQGALPFLISYAPGDRKKVSTLGEAKLGFHGKCVPYMAQNPTLVPAYLDMTKFNNSVDLLNNLQAKRELLRTLCQSLDDTIATVSHFVYGDERAFYDNVGQAAKRGVNGAKAIYDDLTPEFAQGPRKSKTTTTAKPN